ncbi:MAG TPA: outer membrane beta-barrel protein [Opitutaceae bacterium]
MKGTKFVATAALCTVSTLAFSNAFGALDISESLTVEGYLGSSYRYTDADTSFDSFDIDAAKMLFTAKFAPVTGVLSFYYSPTGQEDVTLLDAYVAYDAGNGLSLSAGKFLSWHGYEAFDIVNMYQLTYATGDFLGGIPGYHSGVRAVQTGENWEGGLGVVDSVYTPPGLYLEGDGELKENVGLEAYYKYTGFKKTTLYFGAAYDTDGGFQPDDVLMLNFWGEYALTDSITGAAEVIYKDFGSTDGFGWTLYANCTFTDTVSTMFRVAGEEIDNGPEFFRLSAAPTFSITPNLLVRAELTYTNYDNFVTDDATFVGVQSLFKF